MLKTTEEAVVSGVALRDVNRVIDEGIFPGGFVTNDDGRRVLAAACMLISFYFGAAECLTPEERLLTIEAAVPRLRLSRSLKWAALLNEDWNFSHGVLTVNLRPFAKAAVERMEQLVAARNLVHSTPYILSGTPVIKGTRIPLYDVAALSAAGTPIDDILADYPRLDAEKVVLAKIFVEANPKQGRPSSRAQLPNGAVIISDYRVSGRRPGR